MGSVRRFSFSNCIFAKSHEVWYHIWSCNETKHEWTIWTSHHPHSACDMFEFNKDSATCRFMPHTALKSLSWASYTLSTAPTERKSVFVLQCSSVMENLASDEWNYLTSAIVSAGVTVEELELEETSKVSVLCQSPIIFRGPNLIKCFL